MSNDRFFCWYNECKKEIPEPLSCCSGMDCGCMGQPIEPPFCSNKCFVLNSKKVLAEDQGEQND